MYRRMDLDTKLLLTSLLTIVICYGSIATMKLLIIPFLSIADRSYFSPWILALPQVFLLVFVSALCFRYRVISYKDLGFQAPSFRNSYFLAFLCVLANIFVVVIYMIIATYFEVKFLYTPEIPKNILGFGWFIWLNLFAICIWVPVIEELFFRGFLLRLLMSRLGTFSAVLLSSLVFAVLHGNIGLLIPVFVCSVVISVLYIRTGSIYPSILTHGCVNLSVALVAASA